MAKKLSEFEQAFADARGRGEEIFSFKGEKYHTRRADETPESWAKTMRKRKQAVTDKQYEASKPIIKPMQQQNDLQEEELDSWRSGSRAGGKVKRMY